MKIKGIKLILANLFLLWFFSSCSNEKGIQEVRIVYAPENININVPATCSDFEFELIDVKRKRISEKGFLRKVDDALGKLKMDLENDFSTKSVDVRIRCFVDYKEKTDTLCLGEYEGVILNGELMNDNQVLLDLLKSNLYEE